MRIWWSRVNTVAFQIDGEIRSLQQKGLRRPSKTVYDYSAISSSVLTYLKWTFFARLVTAGWPRSTVGNEEPDSDENMGLKKKNTCQTVARTRVTTERLRSTHTPNNTNQSGRFPSVGFLGLLVFELHVGTLPITPSVERKKRIITTPTLL